MGSAGVQDLIDVYTTRHFPEPAIGCTDDQYPISTENQFVRRRVSTLLELMKKSNGVDPKLFRNRGVTSVTQGFQSVGDVG